MKKLLLAILVIGSSTALAQSPYQGKSLQEFQAEDRELKNALSESGWDLGVTGVTSWFKSPSADRLKRMAYDLDVLKSKLLLIDTALEQATKELEKIRKEHTIRFPSDNPATAVIIGVVTFPWLVANEMVKNSRLSDQQEVVKHIKEGQQVVKERIQQLEKVLLCSR
jgi:hypothetical protein